MSGRHKVYILDEAHMLSPQAWNAFLKTLEEPPPRTIFVLATTEAQKVLPTVVDRCHRFDFGRPSVEQVTTVLRRVAADGADRRRPTSALALIARNATGSFRDALGTLEQLVTYAGDERIRARRRARGARRRRRRAAVRARSTRSSARDPREALRAAARLAESGRDPGQVLRDLEVHGRELLTVQVLGEVPPELRVTPERDRAPGRAGQRAVGDATRSRLLDLVAAALEATANGAEARIQLELVLIKAAAPELDPSVDGAARADRAARGERPARRSGSPTLPPAAPPAARGARRAQRPAQRDAAPQPDAGGRSPGRQPAPAPRPRPRAAAPGRSGPASARAWPAVVEIVKTANAMLAALLADARPVERRRAAS